jgi:lipoprotein-anchoring transpeptidase ErfK/SrfK
MGRLRHGLVVIAAVVAAVAAAVALRVPGDSQAAIGKAAIGKRQHGQAPAVAPPEPTVSVAVDPAGNVPWDQPLQVTVANGQLGAVSVADADGQALPGATSPDGTAWQSAGTLIPQATYTVLVSATGADRRPIEQTLAVTATPAPELRATLSPGDGEIVGVGMPAVVTFDQPVAPADRPVVEQRLSVTTTPPVAGAWRWINRARLHWRPAAYWQSGTEVTVHADLRRLQVGPAWGTNERTIRFRIGEAHISTVDVATHQMTVTENGQVVNRIPISAGRERYPTRNGVHIALAKSRIELMDSATVGIPLDRGGYYKKVGWATRLSYGGTFVHAAPWSVRDQGVRNVSHGCINASPASAQWFFNFTKRGDVVEVVNSTAPPKLSDPGTADWNIPWDQWANGGSTPS